MDLGYNVVEEFVVDFVDVFYNLEYVRVLYYDKECNDLYGFMY